MWSQLSLVSLLFCAIIYYTFYCLHNSLRQRRKQTFHIITKKICHGSSHKEYTGSLNKKIARNEGFHNLYSSSLGSRIKKEDITVSIRSAESGQISMVCFCENGNKLSGSINDSSFLDQLTHYQIFKMVCIPRSSLVSMCTLYRTRSQNQAYHILRFE